MPIILVVLIAINDEVTDDVVCVFFKRCATKNLFLTFIFPLPVNSFPLPVNSSLLSFLPVYSFLIPVSSFLRPGSSSSPIASSLSSLSSGLELHNSSSVSAGSSWILLRILSSPASLSLCSSSPLNSCSAPSISDGRSGSWSHGLCFRLVSGFGLRLLGCGVLHRV